MKITETIFAQLTDTDTILENIYQAIAEVDPNFAEEMAVYEQSVQVLLQADRKSTRLNSSHKRLSRMPSSA